MLATAFIPLLSAFGRPLQHWVFAYPGKTAAAWVIGFALLLLAGASVHWLARRRVRGGWWSVAAIGATLLTGLIIVVTQLHRIEERLHFVTFGVFGFLSTRIFPLRLAIMVCLAGSAGDELFQAWLPDRVGDWRDVLMNTVASAIGLVVARVGRSGSRDPGEERTHRPWE